MTHEHEHEHDRALADLAGWLRSEPGEWPVLDDQAMSDKRMRELTARIIDAGSDTTASVPGDLDRDDAIRRRRRRRIAAGALPIVAVALAAAGWAVLREDATQATSFACLAPDVVVGIPNDGSSPLEVCRDLWEQGHVVPGAAEAPPLVACIDGHGSVAVIESTGHDTCTSRGWAPWADQPDYEAIGDAITAVRIDLHDRYLATGNGCATVTDWQTALAARPAAEGWTIRSHQDAADGHCYDIGEVDPTTRRITLLATRDDHSIGCDPRTGC